MVAVDIARGNLQSARRSDDANGMGANSGQMKLNPIVCERRIAAAGLNDGQIRPEVAVKVRKGKRSVGRNGKNSLAVRQALRRSAHSKAEKNQSAKQPGEPPRRRGGFAARRRRFGDGFGAIHECPLLTDQYDITQRLAKKTPGSRSVTPL
jgi:hypothetical protein